MIEITNEAYTKLIQKASAENNFVLRLGITGGGCGGMEYRFAYNTENYPSDIILDWGRIKFRVDPESEPYIKGMTLDWKKEGLNEQFIFINPNETYRCGCGVSVGF